MQIVKKNTKKIQIEDEVKDIVEKAKDGSMTYAELATKLDSINPEQIDKVFDKFEEMGVDILHSYEQVTDKQYKENKVRIDKLEKRHQMANA